MYSQLYEAAARKVTTTQVITRVMELLEEDKPICLKQLYRKSIVMKLRHLRRLRSYPKSWHELDQILLDREIGSVLCSLESARKAYRSTPCTCGVPK